jgi:hypothetical protein
MMPVVEPSAQALPRDRIVRVMTWNIANCTKTAGHSARLGWWRAAHGFHSGPVPGSATARGLLRSRASIFLYYSDLNGSFR